MIDGVNRNLGLVGGVETLSRIPLGIAQPLADWFRKLQQAHSPGEKLSRLAELKPHDIRLYIPAIVNRTTGLSMGEHTEITAKEWGIGRAEQDAMALQSHQRAVAAWDAGFFDDLVLPVGDFDRDAIPRRDTSMEKLGRLPPAFDKTSGNGTLTAGSSTPLTDGAASLWVATEAGLAKLPAKTPRVKLIDYGVGAVDFRVEGLLMAPAFIIPRLLARQGLRYDDVALWEIHEAFSAQVLFHMKALEDTVFLKERVGVEADFGPFPRDRINPNGGSVALGHPFGATGARILSQAIKELAAMPSGSRAIVSICADGGQGSVALLEAA
jgi:acetyl-CoA C-acetyltransferase